MADHPPSRGTSGWVGWVALAGILVVVVGASHVAQGIVALVADERYAVRNSDLLVDTSYSVWGWTHVILGTVAVLAGFLVFAGNPAARAVATVVALMSIVTTIAFLSAFPLAGALIITLNVVMILALVRHGAEIRAAP